MAELNIHCTPVFARAQKAFESKRFNIYVFEGGSRSSKTYSLIQFFIVLALTSTERKRIACCRKKGTWLLATVWVDFNNILADMGLLGRVYTNNSKHIIRIKHWTFEFVGLDDTQKLHGLTSDAFWINEAMEASSDARILPYWTTTLQQKSIGFMTMFAIDPTVTLTTPRCLTIRLYLRT